MPGVSPLDHPTEGAARRRILAELCAEGHDRAKIAAVMDVHPDTITVWRRRPDVQQQITKLIQDRVNRLTSRIDARLEGLLQDDNIRRLDLKDLLAIRKELSPQIVKLDTDPDKVAEEVFAKLMGTNPEKAMAEAVEEAREAASQAQS